MSLHCRWLVVLILWRGTPAADAADTSSQLFEQRLVPILKSETASSCTECHLAGVELKHFLRESEAETFAALRQLGWIDPKQPEQSKILRFIARQPEKADPLIAKVRQAELKAFGEWIAVAVRNPALLNAKPSQPLETELSVEVIRHARRDRMLTSFLDNVWSEMGRCLNCHSPERNRHLIAKHGKEAVEAVSWIIPRDPEATLERLVADGNIDLDQPEHSPVLTKPAGLVEHGGGPKFLAGGETHAKFLAFLTDYAAIRRGDYHRAADLPTTPVTLAWLTDQHLKLTDVPDTVTGAVLRADLYRWDDTDQKWSADRVGFVEGPINRQQRVFQNMVSQTVSAKQVGEQPELRKQPRLPAGRYQARLFIDSRGGERTARKRSWQPVGEIEFSGDWPPGYQPPKTVSAKSLTMPAKPHLQR